MQVIKDNFDWCCGNNVLDVSIIEQYKEDFSANSIYANVSVDSGFLLCENVTVSAWGNAKVEAYDNAYYSSYSILECKLSGNAIYRVRSTNTVYFASDDIKFEKQ